MRFSVVIPARDEQDSVAELHSELVPVLERLGGGFEVIYVDDGSLDSTPARLAAIAAADHRVRLVRFRANYGKSAAYAAGFAAARGETVLTLDSDLQDDPAEIPNLLAALDEGFDLAVGWKQHRLEHEPVKTVPSRVFNLIKRLVFGLRLHDSNSGFRAMRRAVAAGLDLRGDNYRFIPELAHAAGFRVTERPVAHRRRKFGRSKYGVTRFWTGVLDLVAVSFITRYGRKPLHFFGTLGLVPLLVGVGLEVYVLVRKILGDLFSEHLAALVIGVMLILVGLQLIATGLVGEMVAAGRSGPDYSIIDDDAAAH
jgi:glycosyltransferase involved in cell wall biosynthesis